MPMTLSRAEREKFAGYLIQNADSTELLAAQLGNGSIPSFAADALAKQFKFEIAACRFIAKKLLDTEDVSVGDSDNMSEL